LGHAGARDHDGRDRVRGPGLGIYRSPDRRTPRVRGCDGGRTGGERPTSDDRAGLGRGAVLRHGDGTRPATDRAPLADKPGAAGGRGTGTGDPAVDGRLRADLWRRYPPTQSLRRPAARPGRALRAHPGRQARPPVVQGLPAQSALPRLLPGPLARAGALPATPPLGHVIGGHMGVLAKLREHREELTGYDDLLNYALVLQDEPAIVLLKDGALLQAWYFRGPDLDY